MLLRYLGVYAGLFVLSETMLSISGCASEPSDPPEVQWDEERSTREARESDREAEDSGTAEVSDAAPSEDTTARNETEADAGNDAPSGMPEARYLIPFEGVVGDLPLLCGQKYAEVGTAGSTIEVRDFRFYLHDIELVDGEGRAVPLQVESDGAFHLAYEKADGDPGALVMIDFTDTSSNVCNERGTPHTNTALVGTAPEGTYRRLRFKLGVPTELNHIEGAKAPSPLSAYGMQWSWASGYRYLKADIRATTGEVVKDKHYMHSGASGCTADDGTISGSYACDNALISEIEIPFEFGKDAVRADLAALYAELDLSLGTGCMGSSSLRDFADGPKGADYAGCVPMYASVGLKLSETLRTLPETLGACQDESGLECRDDSDCADGIACAGYVASAQAVPAEQVAQSLFSAAQYDGEPLDPTQLPAVADLSDESAEGWPHPNYERDEELDTSAISEPGGRDSHPKGDARFGSNCMACHQAQGPGPGQYLVAGTVHTAEGQMFDRGGIIAIGTGTANRFGPKTHPIHDRVADFTSLLEIPIDAFGQFYATADMAPALNYADENYLALVIGDEGLCKTAETGEVVADSDGHEVRCSQESDCEGLVYERLGTCDDGAACRAAAECTQGGPCQGYAADTPAICDKLLNAMPLDTVGACNHCHGEAFRIQSTPWTE